MKGFTLIEMMITLAIIALLATLVLPVAETNLQRRKEIELQFALREIRSAIDAYKKATDEGRVIKPANSTGYPKNLEILVDGVTDARNLKGNKIYFLRRIPQDPLAPTDSVHPADTWGKRAYASESDNPKEGEDVYDVYSKSPSIGLNGVPYRKW